MKSTGIVRKVDDLGRIVLPIELRRTLDINERDSIEIFVDGNQIVLKKYSPSCIFCGEAVMSGNSRANSSARNVLVNSLASNWIGP